MIYKVDILTGQKTFKEPEYKILCIEGTEITGFLFWKRAKHVKHYILKFEFGQLGDFNTYNKAFECALSCGIRLKYEPF